MKRYYSIRGHSTEDFQLKEPLILVDSGLNAFTVLTDDIEALVHDLELNGLRVDEVNTLDGTDSHSR